MFYNEKIEFDLSRFYEHISLFINLFESKITPLYKDFEYLKLEKKENLKNITDMNNKIINLCTIKEKSAEKINKLMKEIISLRENPQNTHLNNNASNFAKISKESENLRIKNIKLQNELEDKIDKI